MSDAITMYSKPGCVQCNASERKLEELEAPYTVVDISQDAKALERIKELGYLQAPVFVAPNGDWSGYRPDKLTEAAGLVAA